MERFTAHCMCNATMLPTGILQRHWQNLTPALPHIYKPYLCSLSRFLSNAGTIILCSYYTFICVIADDNSRWGRKIYFVNLHIFDKQHHPSACLDRLNSNATYPRHKGSLPLNFSLFALTSPSLASKSLKGRCTLRVIRYLKADFNIICFFSILFPLFFHTKHCRRKFTYCCMLWHVCMSPPVKLERFNLL